MELQEEIEKTERFYDNLTINIDSKNLLTKDDFCQVISSCLKEIKSYTHTKTFLQETLNCKLGPEDCNYVENKYVELLIEYWFEDTFDKIIQNFNPKQPTEFVSVLNHLCTFHCCYDYFENLVYNNLITDLLETESNISESLKSQENTALSKLKLRCITNVLVSVNNSHGEVCFIKLMINTLKYTKDLEQLIQTLQLRSFLSDQITFQDVLVKFNQEYFSSDKYLRRLQRAASEISQQDHHYTKEIKKVVADYLGPITIKESSVDGRKVLEVAGKHLVFSKNLSDLEQNPNFPDIEEIRFVNFGALHIDTNLSNIVWHGKNLVVLADAVIVSNNEIVTWNVSGKDGDPLEDNSPPGDGLNGVGINGKNGNPGESGGNVCILYGSLKDGHNLHIISNGGNGSPGQNGGNGRNGDDGSHVEANAFKTEFPPVSKFVDSQKSFNIKKTMQRVGLDLRSVDTFSYGYSDMIVTKEEFKDFFNINELGTTYFEVTTGEGCKMMFSFYLGSIFTFCQSYLLIKGGPGKMGEPGGLGGLGGKAGFAGQIQIAEKIGNSPENKAENGEHGANGTPGISGIPGKDGLDRGYMDYSATLLSLSGWPKWFIPLPEDDCRLAIIPHSEPDSNCVWCAKKQSYVKIAKAKRYCSGAGHTLQALHSKPQAPHTETKCEAQVPRKKTINPEAILEHYKENHSAFESFNVLNGICQLKEELEALLEKSFEQTGQVTKEVQVIRQLSVGLNDDCFNKTFTGKKSFIPLIETKTKIEDISIPHLFELLIKNPENIEGWLRFQKVKLNHQDLKMLWDIAESHKLGVHSNELSIESSGEMFTPLTLLRDKHRLAILNTVTNNLEMCGFPDTTLEIKEIDQIEFLRMEEKSGSDTRINLTNVDFVESYLCDDTALLREHIVNTINSTTVEENTMKRCLNIFLQEVDCQNSDTLITLKTLFSDSKRRKEERLKHNFMVFKSEVLKPQNQEIYVLLKGATNKNVTATVGFEQKVAKNKFLGIMYSKLIKELKNENDWEIFTEESESEVRLLFINFILTKGPFSETYREYLSYHYNVNILIYTIQKRENLVLISNHNPTAGVSVHFLREKDRFVRLNFDSDSANLMNNVSKYGEFCSKIMFHIFSLEERTDFEHFISTKPYRSESYEGVNKTEMIRLKIHHVLYQEKYCQQIASSFRGRNDQLLIYSRIEKLKLDFIDTENLLHYMALHFKNEGSQVTCAELCFIINMILRFWSEQPRLMPMVSWIIAAYSQENWLTELALIELEFYMKRKLQYNVKLRWKKYLGDEKNRESLMVLMKNIKTDSCSLTQEQCDEVFYLMSNIPNALDGLENFAISEWKYFLKDRYWAFQIKSISDWNEGQLKEMSFYLVTLENISGTDLCQKILSHLKAQCEELKIESNKISAKDFLKKISLNEVSFNDALLRKLSEKNVKHWQSIIDEESLNTVEERSIDQLVKLIHQSGNTSDKILNCLNDITKFVKFISVTCDFLRSKSETELKDVFDLLKSKSLWDIIISMGKKLSDCILQFNADYVLRLLEAAGLPLPGSHPNNTDKETSEVDAIQLNTHFLVPLIIWVIQIKHNIKLRDTQKLAITTFLENSGNTLQQISTGEGKSLIVVVVAIFKALTKKKVNVITSSKVLAERDAQLYKDIFEFCGVTVGHNCSENIEDRKRIYSNCQVIYGDLTNFQRDYLLDRFYNKNILGDCTFETVIVDEVDSMLLDKGTNILYLSHPIPGLESLEPLFVHVWKFISTPIETQFFKEVFSVKAIKEHFMYQVFGQIQKENIEELDSHISKKCLIDTWDYLINKKIIDKRGIVVIRNLENLDLDDVPSECVSKCHLKYLLKKVIERDNPLQIPVCHRQFVEDHLESWIKSAMNAMRMENGRDYIVDVDRTQTSTDRSPNITIVDRDTGTDLVSSQWDEGLHQFLQLKHGCKLSLISLKNVFISNVSFLKLYTQLHGLTGTLGSKRERELLTEIYSVDFVTIPTAKAKLFTEIPPAIFFNKDEWVEKIISEINIVTEKRSALIICESVNEVLALKDKFPKKHVHIYKRDYEAFPAAEKLEVGHIIISTNLAGRGTDIKLSDHLLRAGGLHVCLSFLPSNSRVEEQAYGRAARNGEPGTAQMIFKYTDTNKLSSQSQSKILDLKRERDMNELIRLGNIKTNYVSKIKPEEKLFEQFKEKYKLFCNKTVKNETVKSILLQICLEKWTFWLDKNSLKSDHLGSGQEMEQSFNGLMSSCESLFEGNVECWLKEIADPVHITKLGLAFLSHDPKTASLLFDEVIGQETNFSESAYYYRVCAKTKAEDLGSITDILNDLTQAFKQLQKKINQLACSMNIIDWIKDHDSKNVLQIDSFKRQQTEKCNIYGLFMQSILQITGHEITPETLVHPLFLDRFRAEAMYHKLIEGKVLTDIRLNSQLSEKNLTFVVKFGLSPRKVKFFLENFNVGNKFEIHTFLKEFKREFKVPCRELFWKELVATGLLKEEIKYVFIDMCQVESIDPSLKNHMEHRIEDVSQINSGKVWLYEQEELFQSNPNFDLCVLMKKEFKTKIGLERYMYLKKRNVFFVNKLATFELPVSENPSFNHFDSLKVADFNLLDIPETVTHTIINDLVHNKVVQEDPTLKVYTLVCDPSQLEEVELLSNRSYTLDVRSLLSVCFAHRIALSKALLLQIMHGGKFSLKFLPSVVYKSMFYDLMDHGVFRFPMINSKVNLNKQMETLYPKEMNKTYLKNMFAEIFGGEKSREIIESLINSNWLLNSNHTTYSVNTSVEKEWHGMRVENSENLSPLCVDLDSDKETISSILINHLKCVHFLPKSIKHLESLKGDYLSVETPDFFLKPLVEVLKDRHIPINDIEIFSIKGFDHFIILEEKRWTWKTKLGLFILIGVAIIEIVIGVALALCLNPLSTAFISEGSNDMIYAISCMFTGHFSWKDYALQKLINLSLSVISTVSNLSKFNSKAGDKIKSVSFKIIKEAMRDLGSVMNKENVKSICITSSATVMFAVTRAVIYSAADNWIEPQLEKLSEAIVETVYSDMNEMIDNYPCPSMEEVFNIFAKAEANAIVSDCFLEVLKESLTTYVKNWSELANIITDSIKLFLDTQRSSDFAHLMSNLAELMGQSISVFNRCTSYWQQLQNIVLTCLRKVEEQLADIVDQVERKNILHRKIQTESSDHEKFVAEAKSNWKNMFRLQLSKEFKRSILSPLIQHCASIFASMSHRYIAQKSRRCLKGQKTREINMLKEKHLMKTSGQDCKLDSFYDSDFDDTLVLMLSKQRSTKLFVELMKRNMPVDISFIDVCCTVIPAVLKKESINCPSLEIIVESSDYQERFYTNKDEKPILSVVISPNTDLKTNLGLNKVLLKDLADAMISGFIQSDPQNKHFTVNFLRNILMEAIEKYLDISESIETFNTGAQANQSTNNLNTSVENDNPSQHSLPGGNWVFMPKVDFDLRTNECTSSAVEIQDHVRKGFLVALEKINYHISNCHETFRHFKLRIEDFEESEFDIVLQANKGKKENFCCQTTKYQLMVPISIISKRNLILSVQFKIVMELKHRSQKILARTPIGPHITYEISPEDSLSFCYYSGTKGHILLNKECKETVYSVENCHVAGELILFRRFSMQKSSNILFFGEMLLTTSTEDTPMKNCVVKSFKNMSDLKTAITEIPIYHKDVFNVILYVGMSDTLTMKPPICIVQDVESVVMEINKHVDSTKITVCGLFRVKEKSAKIIQVNKALKRHCESKRYGFLDLNKVINATDLETDGRHIKRDVLKTIVKEAIQSVAEN